MDTVQIPQNPNDTTSPLTYEETPIIEPLPEVPQQDQQSAPEQPQEPPAATPVRGKIHGRGCLVRFMGQLVFWAILFAAGMYVSNELRPMLAGKLPPWPQLPPLPKQVRSLRLPKLPPFFRAPDNGLTPSVTPTTLPGDYGEQLDAVQFPPLQVSPTPMPPTQAFTTYPIVSGMTRSQISGLSFLLPAGVPAPLCDGSGCPSVGTNLPGKTRFTLAPRGEGQVLPDFRGAILTDASGKEFVMKEIPLSGITVTEFVGDFTGRTGGGYTFTKMRGLLVPVNDKLSVEFNHFAPQGVDADFAADDQVLNQVVASFVTALSSPAPGQ